MKVVMLATNAPGNIEWGRLWGYRSGVQREQDDVMKVLILAFLSMY